MDLHGTVLEVNTRMLELCGVDKESALGNPIFDLFGLEQRELLQRHLKRTKETEAESDLTLESVDSQGEQTFYKLKTAFIEEQRILGYLEDITQEEVLRKEIEYLNYHDSLSGVYNRRFFEEECRRLDVERKMPMGIIIGDVNGLKITNDGFGHLLGDKLIATAAQTMKESLRQEDIIARWGGDEFIILLPETGYKDTLRIVERIKENMEQVMTETGPLSISFGLAVKRSADQKFSEVFKKAEDAMYRQKMHESIKAKSSTLRTIVNRLHENNPDEELHAKEVARYAKKISRVLRLDEEQQKDVVAAGMLHDIGKIAVENEVLKKISPLNREEWYELRKHPEVGCRILSNVSSLENVTEAVLSHHERYDGSGYPQGLRGEDIPELSRIIAIAEAYEAMITDRPYRRALTPEEAKREIEKNIGTQFDPRIARAFLDEVLKAE